MQPCPAPLRSVGQPPGPQQRPREGLGLQRPLKAGDQHPPTDQSALGPVRALHVGLAALVGRRPGSVALAREGRAVQPHRRCRLPAPGREHLLGRQLGPLRRQRARGLGCGCAGRSPSGGSGPPHCPAPARPTTRDALERGGGTPPPPGGGGPERGQRRGPARGPTHLHPTRDTTVNPTTTRSYVEVVQGVAQRSGRPATVRGPPHVTRYILLPRAPTHPPQPPSAQQRHEGEGRGLVLRSPKDGLSAGTWTRKVVMCPRRGNDPASGHPRAHQPPLGRGTSPPAWDGRLDAPGQRRRHLPSSAWTRRREVKQGKSGGSVGTTDQGKGKGRSVVRPMGTVAYGGKGQGKGKGRGEGRLGQGGRGRSKGGEKLMGTTAYGGKGSKGRAANGDRPVGAASCRRDHHTMATCQNPPPGRPAYAQPLSP